MGLDSGIYLKTSQTPWFLKHFNKSEPLDICYWRKCWQVLYDCLNAANQNIKDNVVFELSYDEMKKIRHILHKYNADTWADYCMWEWKEIKPIIKRQIWLLSWAILYKKLHKNAKFMFYYSY